MAVNAFNRSVPALLLQSRLREMVKLSKTEKGVHIDDLIIIFVADVLFPLCFSVYHSISAPACTCLSCLHQTKIPVVLGRDVPGLE